MAVEVVAVRWHCFVCETTAITAPEELPAKWFELQAPVWRSADRPRHYCPEHATEGLRLDRARRARYAGRTHVVSAEEYEAVKLAVRRAVVLLDRLKFSGERAAGREV
ncbi:MAG: hypothetical protein WD810_03430 [Solirubrobacterales bacterium]